MAIMPPRPSRNFDFTRELRMWEDEGGALQPELVEIRNWDIMFIHTKSQKRDLVAAREIYLASQFCEFLQTVFNPHSGRGTRSAG